MDENSFAPVTRNPFAVRLSKGNWAYWGKAYFNAKGVSVPLAVSGFPDELYPAPRSRTERAYPKLVDYKMHDKGGHFAAWEQPKLLSEDVRASLRSLRG